jgi:hypothetical protein
MIFLFLRKINNFFVILIMIFKFENNNNNQFVKFAYW